MRQRPGYRKKKSRRLNARHRTWAELHGAAFLRAPISHDEAGFPLVLWLSLENLRRLGYRPKFA